MPWFGKKRMVPLPPISPSIKRQHKYKDRPEWHDIEMAITIDALGAVESLSTMIADRLSGAGDIGTMTTECSSFVVHYADRLILNTTDTEYRDELVDYLQARQAAQNVDGVNLSGKAPDETLAKESVSRIYAGALAQMTEASEEYWECDNLGLGDEVVSPESVVGVLADRMAEPFGVSPDDRAEFENSWRASLILGLQRLDIVQAVEKLPKP